MKINFNHPFINYKGEPIVKDGHEQLIKDVIAPILFGGEWTSGSGRVLSSEEKIRAYNLSLIIYQSSGAVEITVEDAAMIKEAAQVLNAGGYAQIIHLIES